MSPPPPILHRPVLATLHISHCSTVSACAISIVRAARIAQLISSADISDFVEISYWNLAEVKTRPSSAPA